MKIGYTQIITFLLMVIASIWWCLIMSSCSPNYHMKKFIKKGGIINNDTTTIVFSDTIQINGKDSIIYRTISVQCPELEAPKTRWQTRIEYRYKYKTYHDSIQVVKWKTKYIYKTQKKEIKQEKKKGFAYNLRFIAIISFLVLLIILLFKFK